MWWKRKSRVRGGEGKGRAKEGGGRDLPAGTYFGPGTERAFAWNDHD